MGDRGAAIIDEAFAAADAHDAIVAALKPLSRERARFLIAQVLAEFSDRAPPKPAAEPSPNGAAHPPRAKVAPRSRKPQQGSKTAAVYQYLKDHPGGPIPVMAEAIYGSRDEKSQDRARSLIAALKKRGRVKNVGSGQWEVTG
jgi:hypothetical protein